MYLVEFFPSILTIVGSIPSTVSTRECVPVTPVLRRWRPWGQECAFILSSTEFEVSLGHLVIIFVMCMNSGWGCGGWWQLEKWLSS